MLRRLTTILAADLAGYSRLMAADEEGVITRLRAARADVVDPAIAEGGGRIVKVMGDGLLVEFASPVGAVRAALAVQEGMRAREAAEPEDRRLRFRIGINLGDVVIDGEDVLGDAVNVAARLEGLAPPGAVCISAAVHDQIRGRVEARATSLGPQRVKNLPEPVETWILGGEVAPRSSMAEPAASQPPRLRDAAPSVAVLPFAELGPPTDDYFADGVVEEITAALSRVRDFVVIARQSAFVFKGREVDVRDAGGALGAQYLVSGSIRRSGPKLRISVQLLDAATGASLWSESYDDRLEDLFDLQDRIASHVAGAISPSIRASEIAAARSAPPTDRGAYALLMTAYPDFWAHRAERNGRAIETLSAALDRNPEEFRALALRAWCHAQQACYMWSETPLVSRARALEDANAAALAAGDHAPSLVAIAATLGMTSLDHDRAGGLLDRALSLDPNSAWGWLRLGWQCCYVDEPDDALLHFDRSEALSPRDPFAFNMQFGRAFAHGLQGDFDRAIALCRKGLLAGPGVTWAYRDLSSFCANAGRRKEADEAASALLHHYPRLTVRRVIDSMPPAVDARHSGFLEGLRRAGVPED